MDWNESERNNFNSSVRGNKGLINVLVSLECVEWGTLIDLNKVIWNCSRVIGLGFRKCNALQGEKWCDNEYCFVFLHSSFSVFEKDDVIWMEKVKLDEVNI